MVKLLIWMAGNCALIYAISRLGYWREFAAFAVLTAAALWILGGALMLGQGQRGMRPASGARAAEDYPFADAIRAAEEKRREQEHAK